VTVHLISVGLSVRDALRDPYDKLAGEPDLIAAINRHKPLDLFPGDMDGDAASEWLVGALTPDPGPGRDAAKADRLREVSAAVEPNRWPRHMSAEIETFARVPGTGFPLRPGDIAVLVCSDTPRGLLAGVWNALALTDGDLARVGYLPDPGSLPGDIRARAVLVRVPGLDASDEAGFRRAMGGLGSLARHVFQYGRLSEAERFQFYLSGGFKAAIPYLIGLAEAVRSIDASRLRDLGAGHLMPADGPYPVDAFVLHETAPPGTPPIRLPLRRLDADAVRYELSRFDRSGHRRGKPDGALLQGYAYEVEGRPGKETCELTAFGEGLRELFGVEVEVPGG
jgi:hypothetical protein